MTTAADEKASVNAHSIARAIKVAQLGAAGRRFLTNIPIDDMENMSRVVLALNLVATEAAALLQEIDEGTGQPVVDFTEPAAQLAGVLLALGYISEKEDTDGQEG